MDIASEFVLACSSLLVCLAVAVGAVRLGPLWDMAANRQMGALAIRFEQLALDKEQLRLFLRFWGVVLVAGVTTIWLGFGMSPLAAIYAGLVYMAPRHALDYLILRRVRLLRDQMVGTAQSIANAIEAGLSIAQAFESVCPEVPQPLRAELSRIVFDYQRGRPLKDAMESVRERLCLEEFTLFALAIEVALERGGRLNGTLNRISESLREKQRLERKLRSAVAAGRQVVLILAVTPAVFLVGFYLMDKHSVSLLFETLYGQLVLALVILLDYAGCAWAWKIMKVEL